MPYPIAALIAWCPFYQSFDEHYDTSQNYDGDKSYDSQNFLHAKTTNGYCYGYVPFQHENMHMEKLTDSPDEYRHAESIKGIRVYWLARRPDDDSLCLVGWYEKAEAFRHKQPGPIQPEIPYRFRARHSFLFPENQRPEVNLKLIGVSAHLLRHNISYLDNLKNKALLRENLELLADKSLQSKKLIIFNPNQSHLNHISDAKPNIKPNDDNRKKSEALAQQAPPTRDMLSSRSFKSPHNITSCKINLKHFCKQLMHKT